MKTLGRLEGQTPFTDGQLFIGAANWLPLVVADAPIGSAGAGLFTRNCITGTTSQLFANISSLLRTGQLATPGVNQQQFGTAAAVPGPSSVSNTSDPLDLPPGFPPAWTPNNVLPTLSGGQKGPIPKGLMITSVDVIYEVDTDALTSVTFGLTQTTFPAIGTSAAPTVTNIIALGANSLPVAANTAGQVTPTRINIATPAFVNAFKSEIIANINFDVAGGTAKFYGIILNSTFNYN
jgi:hypothetical protein